MSRKKQTNLLRFIRPNSTEKATKVDSQSEVQQNLGKDISEAATVSLPVEEGNIEVKRDAVKEREKVSTENNLIEVVVKQSRGLTDEEKYKLLTTTQNDEIRDEDLNVEFFTTPDGKRKQIKFQKRWPTKNSLHVIVPRRVCREDGVYLVFYF